jgi:hypothetical protein
MSCLSRVGPVGPVPGVSLGRRRVLPGLHRSFVPPHTTTCTTAPVRRIAWPAPRPARTTAGAWFPPCATRTRRSCPASPAYRLAGFAPRQDFRSRDWMCPRRQPRAGDAGVASVVAQCPVVRNAVQDPWPARRARMLYVLRRQEHVSVRMCASGVGEVASSPYTFVVGPGARWRPRCTRVDGGCLRRPTPRRLVFAWRSEARRLLDERECAIEPHLSFCWSCCRILFCWCWAFTRGGS